MPCPSPKEAEIKLRHYPATGTIAIVGVHLAGLQQHFNNMTPIPQPSETQLPTPSDHGIYIAISDQYHRTQMEELLVLDGFNISAFPSAAALWNVFQARPTRMVITERRFPSSELTGLGLCRNIRKHFTLPYIYVVVFSTMDRMQEIKEGLAAGVDDYLAKPLTPLQARTRVLVGRRWLAYIDSIFEGRK
jgi:CheY-like chemotaxis protein